MENFFEQYVADTFSCMELEFFKDKNGNSIEDYELSNEQIKNIANNFRDDRYVSILFSKLDEVCIEYITEELRKVGIEEKFEEE